LYVPVAGDTAMAAVSGATAMNGNEVAMPCFQTTVPVEVASLKMAWVSASARVSLPLRLTAPVAPRPPPPVRTIRAPVPVTASFQNAAGRVLDRVVSQGPNDVPLSLAPMMYDCPATMLVVVGLQGFNVLSPLRPTWPAFPPPNHIVVLSDPS